MYRQWLGKLVRLANIVLAITFTLFVLYIILTVWNGLSEPLIVSDLSMGAGVRSVSLTEDLTYFIQRYLLIPSLVLSLIAQAVILFGSSITRYQRLFLATTLIVVVLSVGLLAYADIACDRLNRLPNSMEVCIHADEEMLGPLNSLIIPTMLLSIGLNFLGQVWYFITLRKQNNG